MSVTAAGPSAAAPSQTVGSGAPPLVKVALLGDSQVGKTSLMGRYVEGSFEETELQTQGVNFMEKTISIREHPVTFSIWDIGGHKDYESMLPLVCNDAAAILLMFDLTRTETLDSLRHWHRKARERNKCAMPMVVGGHYDQLIEMPWDQQQHIALKARQFAEAIHAPLVFCAPSVPINVTNLFKIILIQLFGLNAAVPQLLKIGEPLLQYSGLSAVTHPEARADGSARPNSPCATPRLGAVGDTMSSGATFTV
mmetsp:Transcript_31162/g.51645  ORF Transcript_31162/g.51645 Transcript_31162/m.51645 type:complete len:253 (-) Transcript_31162:321-1079(-)|eukprot:CAMPEP_0119315768 /NCGR_PEP_ID=MMETSP1333-20130426/37087_1 /TAXON_ID=418940 /ORGANISM="Scyphosphaera apsteinii, Strain RCC1455" /LENGTH=252 /DNA_ID=CAMNT_0007321217 /DNA_START=24 /DNA_END=782 /DNA_ORIENTATION=+